MEKKSSKDRAKAGKRTAAPGRRVVDLTPSKAGEQEVKGGYVFKPIDKMTPK